MLIRRANKYNLLNLLKICKHVIAFTRLQYISKKEVHKRKKK